MDLTQAYFTLLAKGTVAAAESGEGTIPVVSVCRLLVLPGRPRRSRAGIEAQQGPAEHLDRRVRRRGRYVNEPAHGRHARATIRRRTWALALIGRVFDRLERHYTESGRGELFRRLKPVVAADPAAASYDLDRVRARYDCGEPACGGPWPARSLRNVAAR